MTRTQKTLKWLGIGLAGLLAVVFAGGGLGYVWLQSDSGRTWLIGQIEAAVSTPGEVELSLGALEGHLPDQLYARDIVLRDAEGPWLTVAALDVDWRPWRLLSSTLEIEAITASAVDFARLPAAPAQMAQEEASDSSAGGLLNLPFKVRIGRLAVDEIALGEPVLGQAARLTLVGEAARGDGGTLSTTLDLRRIDEIEGFLTARLLYQATGDVLTAEITAASAPDGLIATLLDMPDLPRAELRLSGSAPLAAWQGDFGLTLGDLLEAEAAIGLRRDNGQDIGFTVDGQATASLPGDDPALALVNGHTAFAAEGRWQPEGRLEVQRLTADKDDLALAVSGSIAPATGALDLELTATATENAALTGLLDLNRLDRVSVEIALSGTLNRPSAQIDLNASGIASPDFAAATAVVNGTAEARSDLLGRTPAVALDLHGGLGAPRLPGQAEINQILGAALSFLLQGDVDLNTAVFNIAALEASLENATLTATGQAKADDGTATLDTKLQIADLARLQPLTEIRLDGSAELTGPVAVESFGSRVSADMKGRWEQPGSEIALIARAAGKGMDLTARITLDGSYVRIEDATAASAVARVTAAMTVTPEPALRDGRYTLTLPQSSVLAEDLGIALSGPARAEGSLAGPLDALNLNGTAQLEQLTLEDQVLSSIAATYKLRLKGPDIDGPVTLSLASSLGPVEASSDISLRSDKLSLTALRATLAGTRITGEAALPLDSGDPSADIIAEIADLGPWLRLAELDGAGKGKLGLRLNRPEAPAPVTASLELLEARILPAPGAAPLRAGRVTLELKAQDPALAREASLTGSVQTLRWERLELARLDLDGQGTASDLGVRLNADGTWVEPFDLRVAGRLTRKGETLGIDLAEAQGNIFGQPLALQRNARITLAPQVTTIEDLEITSGKTRLTADGQLGDGRMEMRAALDALPLSTVDAFWDSGLAGEVSARVDLAGSYDDPRGTAELTVSGLRPAESGDLPELTLTAAANWQAGRVKLDGELGGPDLSVAAFSVDAPLRMAADGSGPEVPPQAPLSAEAKWSGDLKTLMVFVPLPQHRLKGDGVIDVTVGGTVGRPQLGGSITLRQGRYENLETGTVLGDLELSADLSDNRVTLASLTANDGNGGKVNGSGSLVFDDTQGAPLDVTITLDKFQALRRDDVTAIAGGTVKLNGSFDKPRVEGRITTDTVEISLLAQLPPSVAKLDVIEIKNGVVQEKPQISKAEAPIDADLDIVIDMPRRVFVRGRGLDSEWAGRIAVQGSAAEPVISGEVNLVRGQMDVVGKSFTLSEGKVTLPKAANGEATLDVTAIHKGKDLDVTAKMSGPLTKPELELSSVPEVPRDEIISRVLFDKSAGNLSAGEAAQLAIALRELTGNGGGTDILGFARRTLGVDVLRVETAEGSTPALEAGKYLTDEVYLGVKQGTTSRSSAAGVEVELTPNITVESEISGSGDSKSGVRFQLDY